MTEPNRLNENALVPVNVSVPATDFEVFHLDSQPFLKDAWHERELRAQQIVDNEKWIKAHDELLAKFAQGAGRLFLEGREVAAWVTDGTFKKKQFLNDFPDVAEECSTWEKVLNLDLLKKNFPDVYAANRARTMRRKNNPVVPS